MVGNMGGVPKSDLWGGRPSEDWGHELSFKVQQALLIQTGKAMAEKSGLELQKF